MYKNRSRGFTLIELLVVIAIIGILSAVVLASLNTARSKGNDAAIQSDLSTIQTEAEIYYGGIGANSYGTTAANTACPAGSTAATTAHVFTDPVISKAIGGMITAAGSVTPSCFSSVTTYAISEVLSTGKYWCVDSTGAVGSRTTAATAAGCPAS